ncbi:MAG: magnesium transporter [Clostridiales bacterium]|nr:magnesium transporter [Clostridiales bacterium]
MTKTRITELLEQKRYNYLYEQLNEMNAVDIAEIMDELPSESSVRVFRLLSKDLAAEVFANLPSDKQEFLIGCLSDAELERVTADMFIDDTVELLSEMPATIVKRILRVADPADRRIINELLNYPENSAGSIMTTEFMDLREHMTVEEAIEKIRREGIDKETIYNCYILDSGRVLKGVITVKDLLLAPLGTVVGDIMETAIISVHTLSDKESAVMKMKKYGLMTLPVVDSENRLVGIITIDDAVDIIVSESNEDISLLSAVSPSEEPYLKTSVRRHALNRIPWLILLMFTSIVTGLIIAKYEEAFTALPLLVSFLPMLMDTGGNSGAQASALVIRGLATGDLTVRDYLKVLWKEFRISILCSIALAVVNGIRILVQFGDIRIALIVSATLSCTVVAAKIIGCSLPMLAKRLGLDPALISSPFITTLVDTFAVFLYFNIAIAVMGNV